MTQSIRLRWRPELRFYERRIAILKRFEEHGLEAFSVEEDAVSIRLPNWRWLSVTSSGLTVSMLAEDDDPDDAWADIEVVYEQLQPLQFSHARVSYQHVVELPLTFEEAIARGHDRLYRGLSTSEVTLTDWALLSDIVTVGPPAARGQVEFGIVRKHEVPARLSRLTGRSPGMLHLGQREWDLTAFKDVSLFADSDLTSPAEAGREAAFLGDASSFWNTSREQMTRLVAELRDKLVGDEERTD